MASIGPEDYNIGKNMVNKYEAEVDEYLNANQAIIFKDDVQKRIAEGNRLLGRLDVLIECLGDYSLKREAWIARRNSVQEVVQKIEDEW